MKKLLLIFATIITAAFAQPTFPVNNGRFSGTSLIGSGAFLYAASGGTIGVQSGGTFYFPTGGLFAGDAVAFRAAIGAGVGTGTVTSVGVTAANGVSAAGGPITGSGSFTFTLGNITPSKVNGNTFTTGTGTLTLGANTLNIGTGGTLGSAAFTASTAYATAAQGATADAAMPRAGGTFTGNVLFTDNLYDIGASGATRPRTGYFGTSVITPSATVSGLTSGRVPFASTGGLIADSSALTFNSGTGALSATSFIGTTSAGSLTGTVPVANGGTNIASYTIGDMLYASGATTLSKLAAVASNQVLVSTGAGSAPAWTGSPTFAGTNLTGTAASLTAGNVTTNANQTGDVTSVGNATTYAGVVPVAKGGTNISSYTTGDLLYASGSTTLSKLAAVASNAVLVSQGVGVATAWTTTPTIEGLSILPQSTHFGTSTGVYNLYMTQAFTGTSASSNGENMMLINTTSDNVAIPGNNYLNNLAIGHTFGGSATKGGRQTLFVTLDQTAATSAASGNRNYVVFSPWLSTVSGDGGTNLGAGALGAYFAMNPVVRAKNGATNIDNMSAMEINVASETGSSIKYKSMIQLAAFNTDAVHGSDYDVMLSMSDNGGIGWNDGILFSPANGAFPIAAAGTMIRSTSATITNGVDLSATTFTGKAFKSNGFSVSQSGIVNSTDNGEFPRINFGQSGASGYVANSASADLYVGTINTKNLYLISNNTVRGQLDGTTGALAMNAGISTNVFTSTASTGTAPLVVASTTAVANLNASLLLGNTWASPGTIGGGTAGVVNGTTINATSTITSAIAAGGTGLLLNASTGTANSGMQIQYSRGGSVKWKMGTGVAAASDGWELYDTVGAKTMILAASNGALSMPSGLAVTGTLSATGNTTIGASGTAFLTVTNTTGTGGTTINAMGGPVIGNFKSADSADTASTRWTFGRDNQSTGDFVWLENSSERMRILTGGGLSVTGTGTFTGDASAASFTIGAGLSAKISATFAGNAQQGIALSDSTDASGAGFINFRNAATTIIGSIARVTTTNAVVYNTTSDERIKENFGDLTFARSGQLIDSLKGRTFDRKDGTDNDRKGWVGFVAQQVNKADPLFARIGFVTPGDNDPDKVTKVWGVGGSPIDAVIVTELQSLRARATSAEAKLTDLESRLAALEKK